jgi:hypothetical protein
MKVSSQLYVPAALPPGKEPLVIIGLEAGWVELLISSTEFKAENVT